MDSAQSTILTSVGIGRHAFGDIHTVSIPNPEFKCLCGGTLAELKVEIREDSGEFLNNHSLPIAVTLEIQQVWVSMVQPPEAELATGPDNRALKAWLDAQVGLRVLKASDTMTGEL